MRVGFAWVAFFGLFAAPLLAGPLPALHAEGMRIVDGHGQPVLLKGCNLGNWLVIEGWMLRWDIEDQETLFHVWADRFGAEESQRLIDAYRAGFIAPRDFTLIRSFGFNLVRLPFDARLLIDDSGALRHDPFRWLDHAVDLAERAEVYVVLDMHGAPGGQSMADHTGLRNQNHLWTDPAAQQHMVDLWHQIAGHFKDRSTVVAYDLLNEPYANHHTDVRPDLRELMPKCYDAVRSTGDQHIVFFPNALGKGISFYGDLPRERGMTQVAFTDHYYPGLFGSPPNPTSHARMIKRMIPAEATYLKTVDAPMFIGEFNVVNDRAGGKPMMRRYYDEFAQRGWMCTMWSYKLLKPAAGVYPDSWEMVTNAKALPQIDCRKSSLKEIQDYVAGLGTMELAVDEQLRQVLTEANPPVVTLPEIPASHPATKTVGPATLAE